MNLINARNLFSKQKIQELKNRINQLDYIKQFENSLCIYVTGSFARGEASPHSDIDIFFICKKSKRITNLQEIILKADLIKIVRDLNLPDFSGDGEFLTIHNLEDIIKSLGSPEDDYKNYFTARLLLLLESKPIFNEKFYKEAISKIVNVYFNDYADHSESFSPKFLANDVTRFWKTMLLNYEQKRSSNRTHNNSAAKSKKAKLKNLKLKFSRITTCYSLLCCLRRGKQTTPNELISLITLTPIERLNQTETISDDTKIIIKEMITLYEWFLESTAEEASRVIEWIVNDENQALITKNTERYHYLFYELIKLTSGDLLQYYTL